MIKCRKKHCKREINSLLSKYILSKPGNSVVIFIFPLFLPRQPACSGESRPFVLMTDSGSVWHLMSATYSVVYFWLFSALSVNIVFVCWFYFGVFFFSLCFFPHEPCGSSGLQTEISICPLSTALWDSYERWCCRAAPSTARHDEWCNVMKCDTSYLVVTLIIYIHLCWMWKLGCCAPLCNNSFILSVQKWTLEECPMCI